MNEITAQHVFSDLSERDPWVRKNMSQRPKGFQGNLDTTIIKNSSDCFHNSLSVRDYCKTFHSGIPSGELQSVKVGRLKQS